MQRVVLDGAQLRQLRKEQNLTQVELATQAGIGERTVRNAESEFAIRRDFAACITSVLDVSLDSVVRLRIDAPRRVGRKRNTASGDWKQKAAELEQVVRQSILDEDWEFLLGKIHPGVQCRIRTCATLGVNRQFAQGEGFRDFAVHVLQTIRELGILSIQVCDVIGSGNLVIWSGRSRLSGTAPGIDSVWWQAVCQFQDGKAHRIDVTAGTQEGA